MNGVCNCTAGHEGDLCETETDRCQDNPCQYGGKCISGLDSFTCNCFPTFFGPTCTEADCCSLDPCQNNGSCVSGVDNHTCICMAGYEGDNCEIETDECQSNPCQNGGVCTDGVNSFTCDCGARGFDDDPTVCRPSVSCDPNPCQNGGTCHVQLDGFSCQCSAYYVGPLCSNGNTLFRYVFGVSLKVVCLVSYPLYSYGVSQLDVLFPAGDDTVVGPVPIDLDCFPYASKRHASVYVRLCTPTRVQVQSNKYVIESIFLGVYQRSGVF